MEQKLFRFLVGLYPEQEELHREIRNWLIAQRNKIVAGAQPESQPPEAQQLTRACMETLGNAVYGLKAYRDIGWGEEQSLYPDLSEEEKQEKARHHQDYTLARVDDAIEQFEWTLKVHRLTRSLLTLAILAVLLIFAAVGLR